MNKHISMSQANNIDCGYKSFEGVKVKTCAYCKQKYRRYASEIEYKLKLDGKYYFYCSYNCRSKARKEYEKQQFENVDLAKFDEDKNIKTLLIEMNAKNMTYLEMSLEIGICHSTIARLFKYYGIEKNKQSHGGKK